jgi:hypothetical protein
MNKVLGSRVACIFLLLLSAFGQDKTSPQQTPPDGTKPLSKERVLQNKPASGYVPDATTAVRIAEAVLIRIYGAKQVSYKKPFQATLDRSVWTVSGTRDCGTNEASICVGGVIEVQLSKNTGAILRVVHEE